MNLNADERDYTEKQMREDFERNLPARLDRMIRVPIGSIGPLHHFATPILECRRMFIAGHFYGCISLVQAVAEAVARFLLSKNPHLTVPDPNEYATVVNTLQRDRANPVITPATFAAFGRIRGPRKGKEDRNVYHHLDEDIELDPVKLEARAEQCLLALHEIESDVFGFTINDGKIVLKKEKYWDVDPATNMVRVMVRCEVI